MNKGLDKIRKIEVTKLKGEFYLESLIEQAYTKGLLSDNDIERLQYESLNLLSYKTERYNAGDSSSIQIEKAQDIMTSNLFTIGLWLKTFSNPDDAVKTLQNEPINELYQKGRKRIDTMLASAKAIHNKLLRQLVDTPNVFYSSTIDGGIKGFFKLYYPEFTAHEIHITADYPVLNPMPKLAGIEFIQAYLDCLYYENLFCSNFAADDIHHLLCGYVEDYQEHLINIYEPILLAALGCAITGTDVNSLDITEQGALHLYHLFADMPQNEIAPTIQNAANELIHILDIPHGLVLYVQSSLPLIISTIKVATQEQTLHHVFVRPTFPENKPKIIVSFGDKMDNESYRKVIDNIMQCSSSQNKFAIIKEQIHSLADLEDVLLDAELSQEEIQIILCGLNLPEIVALTKRYNPMSEVDSFNIREQEQMIQKCLHELISQLPQRQQDIIMQASKVLEEE